MKKTFSSRCYALLSKVPRGKVTTYKALANALGTKAYRAVGNAMNKNPHDTKKVPCHRVVAADGSIGGYAWGIDEKIKRLKSEGVFARQGRVVDFEKRLFDFSQFLR